MNAKRWVGAIFAVWTARVLLNGAFYALLAGPYYERLAAAQPGIFKEQLAGYVGTDLLFAVTFVLLFARASAALGNGVRAGAVLGLFVGVLASAITSMNQYFTFAFASGAFTLLEIAFQLLAHVIQGVVAGAICRSASGNGVVHN